MSLAAPLKQQARALGFDAVGIAPADLPGRYGGALTRWLDRGFHGEMAYMARAPRRRADPRDVLPGARSVISLAMNYYAGDHGARPDHRSGRIARYAWGKDYHDLIERKLDDLAAWLRARAPEAQVRGYVDHGPVLERAVAQEAGVGFIGKNTMLITDQCGSWVVLAELITTLELEADRPQTSRCGSCRLCLDACPTGAIVAPYELDATRCISYLTIELKREFTPSEGAKIGDWLFGCDVCQEVCPYNTPPAASDEPWFQEGVGPWLDARETATLQHDGEMAPFSATPLTRPKRAGLVRNARAVLENLGPLHVHERLPGGQSDGGGAREREAQEGGDGWG
ncbi:MAG TPA: tRNA epoxyqueuosine(34) reductase QueG [Nitrospiria bacterium]|nr:tRNA epoxyqueuosine(34) reductase QueG [Nitrospiria bacterium]